MGKLFHGKKVLASLLLVAAVTVLGCGSAKDSQGDNTIDVTGGPTNSGYYFTVHASAASVIDGGSTVITAYVRDASGATVDDVLVSITSGTGSLKSGVTASGLYGVIFAVSGAAGQSIQYQVTVEETTVSLSILIMP